MKYDNSSPEIAKAHVDAQRQMISQLSSFGQSDIGNFLQAFAFAKDGVANGVDLRPLMKSRFEEGDIAKSNAMSRQLRNRDIRKKSFGAKFPSWRDGLTTEQVEKAIAKGTLDVGSLTNLANVTGGQSLGLVSMDTRLARGTVRPKSFSLYHHLNKTMAWQIVDYWAYASDVGAGLPGTAYTSYSSATSGNSVAFNSGQYQTKYLNLKLAVDGRAITMALAQQNSFVNVAEQESTNAALNILSSVEWTLYWGNPTLYPNQPQGIAGLLPASNISNFYTYYNSTRVQAMGISQPQALFNLIYEVAGEITSWRQFGQITHAFMTPFAIADLQTIVTGVLRTIANDVTDFQQGSRAIVVDGELRGMNTNFGDIAFALDFFITARDTPAQAQLREADNTDFTTASLPAPASITLANVASGNTNAAGSLFNGSYTPSGGGSYWYAAAAADQYMNESVLTFSGSAISGVTTSSAVSVTVAPGAGSVAAGIAAFRIYRSGLNFAGTPATWTNATNPNGTVPNPAAFKYVGSIAANGSSNVVFYDLNTHIPGSESIFLLDLDEEDDALDYRVMLPLSKIELFANNLFMPWAVAHIGAPRVRIPKFHARIDNYVPVNPLFDPLSANATATPLI